MKNTKILVTYGPAVASAKKIAALVEAGANAIRINCSHGLTADFLKAAGIIHQGTQNARFPVGLVFDIAGPKLRLDRFQGELTIKKGQKITLQTGKSDLKNNRIGVSRPEILKSVKKGERLFIDDGNLQFAVISVESNRVVIQAGNGGVIASSKGINLPDSDIKIPTVGEKDREDIKTAIRADADYIALSFVRSGDDILEAKRLIKKFGGRQKLIAKLERREAIKALDEIMALSDGVMVARGDLGVELPPAELPSLQKKIVSLANRYHRPVIIATQMLESMRYAPRATRAEINDVASAVFDYADAVMLSAETATGKFPLEAVRTMDNVIRTTEKNLPVYHLELDKHIVKPDIPLAIAQAVREMSPSSQTRVVFAFTSTGFTAELISNLFPPQPIVALTPDKKIMGALSLYRSVYPVPVKQSRTFDDMLAVVNEVCRKYRLVSRGQKVIITGGVPLGMRKPTNFMMIHEVS
ncbi:MAG: pyruvate kinase [candidate division Zixibacteria bacterium]|nr:pyruvate kinase [candidate division Zixibacteria bacterium]